MADHCDNAGAAFKTGDGMRGEVFDIADYLTGMFREDDFRPAVDNIDWTKYSGKAVLVRGCGRFPVPTWAYMVIAARLSAAGAKVYYGEPADPCTVF